MKENICPDLELLTKSIWKVTLPCCISFFVFEHQETMSAKVVFRESKSEAPVDPKLLGVWEHSLSPPGTPTLPSKVLCT